MVDTNVLVSGLINPAGVPGSVVDLITDRQLSVLFDDRILSEYSSVLLDRDFPFGVSEARDLIGVIRGYAMSVLAAPLSVELPDATDIPFVEVAVAGAAEALVTGNTRHFQPVSGEHDVTVLNPREFIDLWLERQ